MTPNHGINLEGASWVVIQGFTVTGMPRAGIRAVLNHHVTIRGNTCNANGYWGVFTGFTDDVLIENNTASNSVNEHGIYVSNSGDRPIIRHNHLFGNHANGVHMNGDISQGGDGIITGALVEGNIIHDNGTAGGSGINADGVQGSRFQNNLIYGNHAGGITLYQIDGGAPVDQQRGGAQHDRAGVGRPLGHQHHQRRHRRHGAQQHPLQLPQLPRQHHRQRRQPHRPRQRLQRRDGSLHHGRRRHADYAGAMARGHRPGHALAHRGAGRSVRQQRRQRLPLEAATSPAKDAGLTLAAVTVDIDGVARPSGPAVDIGAYEVPVSAHTLTVTRRGSATGTVTSSPAGINCGATCSAAFTAGASVTLTAAPAGGAGFVRWTGACSGTLPECTVTMSAALTATATFGRIFTDDPLAAGATVVKAAHVLELRAAIDSLRAWRSLSAISWTDQVLTAGVTPISATHLTQLRSALDGVYVADGLTPPAWGAAPVAGVTMITAAQFEQVRTAIRAVE